MGPSAAEVAAYAELLERGELTARVSAAPLETRWEDQAKLGLRRGFGSPWLRLGALKGFADGSLGSTTAYFFQPYTDDPGTSGLLSDEMQPIDGMLERLVRADAAGLQLCIHAIGDRAISIVLDLLEDVLKANGPRDRRWRIEHAQHVAPTVMTDDGCSPAETLTSENGRITYWGISFHLDATLGTNVPAQQCAAVPFRLEDAPGTAHPAGVTFTFPTDRQRVDFQPLIAVYAIEGDMKDYLYPLNSLGDLQNLLKLRPVPSPWFDAAPLHVRPQYLDFAGGTGVRVVIQYMQDVFFYTNNGLLYNFDGLTSDGRYYVNVGIPLAVPFLMDIEHSDPLIKYQPGCDPHFWVAK